MWVHGLSTPCRFQIQREKHPDAADKSRGDHRFGTFRPMRTFFAFWRPWEFFYTVEHLYERSPEKHHLTVLMRGENADDRIRRFNVVVRMFPADSEFVKDLLPKIIGLNATIYSPVMVVSGVRNNQAAAIFLSSETLNTHSHSSAMRTFLFGLSPAHAESGL
jgi:hypothetical protein